MAIVELSAEDRDNFREVISDLIVRLPVALFAEYSKKFDEVQTDSELVALAEWLTNLTYELKRAGAIFRPFPFAPAEDEDPAMPAIRLAYGPALIEVATMRAAIRDVLEGEDIAVRSGNA